MRRRERLCVCKAQEDEEDTSWVADAWCVGQGVAQWPGPQASAVRLAGVGLCESLPHCQTVPASEMHLSGAGARVEHVSQTSSLFGRTRNLAAHSAVTRPDMQIACRSLVVECSQVWHRASHNNGHQT